MVKIKISSKSFTSTKSTRNRKVAVKPRAKKAGVESAFDTLVMHDGEDVAMRPTATAGAGITKVSRKQGAAKAVRKAKRKQHKANAAGVGHKNKRKGINRKKHI